MNQSNSITRPEIWTSRSAFLMASIGAAVGLGNIWRFPYIAGVNGGSGFVLIYIGFVFLLGLPVMVGEMVIGRRGKANAIASVKSLAEQEGGASFWRVIGWLSIAIPFLGLSYYSVVAAWSMDYLGSAATGAFADFTSHTSADNFSAKIGKSVQQVLLHGAFIAVTVIVVARGVQGGIEKVTKIAMPALLAILVFLVAYNAVTSNFSEALHFLFEPDFSQIGGTEILMALGQALFSLAIGVGAMITYSAYMPREFSLPESAAIICIGDTAVALLAGLAIFPLVFQFGLAPSEGPGLIFITLPIAFGEMPGGQIIGTLFFLLLFFAAFTTAIGMLEPVVAWLIKALGLSRPRIAVGAGVGVWVVGIVSVLSFGLMQGVHPLAIVPGLEAKTFFDILDFMVANIMLPINALLMSLFVGWVVSKATICDELSMSENIWLTYWRFAVRYLVPIAMLGIIYDLWN